MSCTIRPAADEAFLRECVHRADAGEDVPEEVREGKRFAMVALGMRLTEGTLAEPSLLPHTEELRRSFQQRCGSCGELSAGARALYKHLGRSSSFSPLWGDGALRDSEADKNARAMAVLDFLLRLRGGDDDVFS